MRKMLWVLVAGLALALSLPGAAAQGRGQGAAKGKPETKGRPAEKGIVIQKGKPGEKAKKEEKEAHEERARQAAQGRAFGKEHEKTIREWFGNNANLQGLPPGLAKRQQLPPGLQRHLERNGTLPPGLQKRIQPLPTSLESKLPKTPQGVKRVVVAGNVILLEERTAKILDILKDAIPGGARRSERATTGVRRTQ